jgi:hypothetical protein
MELGNMLFGHSRGEAQVPREDEWEAPIFALMDALKAACSPYGTDYDCDLFEMHPYWWGDEDAPEASRPNFRYKPTGFELCWYKWALRDAYMTPEVTLVEWRLMFAECKARVEE